MPALAEIEQTMRKLTRDEKKGRVVVTTSRGGENRYSFYVGKRLVFTFGIIRSSRKRSMRFHYVPRQMHLTNTDFRSLHDCPMSKDDYLRKLIENGVIDDGETAP